MQRLGEVLTALSAWLCRPWRTEAALVVFCLALYTPGFFSIRAVDRDESRFAQASRQMLEGKTWHDWIVPRVQERPRLQKPPLIYWCQATAAGTLTGRAWGGGAPDAIWMYRVPSLLAAIGAVILTVRTARLMFDARAAAMAGVLMAACPLMVWEAKQARADMLMLFFTSLSVHALWRCVREISKGHLTGPLRWNVVLWVAVGLGTLTKGPITPMIVILSVTVMIALRVKGLSFRALRSWMGVLIVAAINVPWLLLLSQEKDMSEYAAQVFGETAGRAGAPKEGHWGPVGYHVLVIFLGFFPGCLMIGPGLVRAFTRGIATRAHAQSASLWQRVRHAHARHLPEAFLLSILLPSWIVFEVSGTKLPHYTLPLYPVITILSARALFAASRDARLRRPVMRVLHALYCLLPGAFLVGPLLLGAWTFLRLGDKPNALGTFGFAILAAWAGLRWCIPAWKQLNFLRLQTIALVFFCVGAMIFGWAVGSLPDVRVSHKMATVIREADPSGMRPIASVSYHEDSLIFETHGRSRRVNEWKLREWLASNPNAIVIIPAKRAPYWPRLVEISRVKGMNYSNGKPVDCIIGEFFPPRSVLPGSLP